MTSQKFSANKRSAFFDFKTAMKSMTAPSIISFLVALYFFVIRVYSEFSVYFDKTNPAKTIENIRNNIVIALTSNDYNSIIWIGGNEVLVMSVFAIIVGVLFAFAAYLFLMRKKCVNVYLSMGIDRKTIFKNRTAAAMILMAVSSLIPIIIDIAVNIHFLGDAGYILYHSVFLFLEYYTYMLVGFSMMSISMALCNTIVESLFFGAGFIWAPTVLVTAFNEFCSVFLRGFTDLSIFSTDLDKGRTLLNYTSVFNPLLFGKALGNYNLHVNVFTFVSRGVDANEDKLDYYTYFTGYGREYLSKEYIIPVIIWLAVCCVFLFTARRLFLKRKAENAGLHGVKTSVNAFVAIELSLLAAVAALAVSNSVKIHINGVLTMLTAAAVFVIVYFILMSISKRKIKHGKDTIIPAIAAAGAVCVTMAVLSLGGFGYTNRTPAIDDIDYAMISSYSADGTGNEGYADGKASYYSGSEIFIPDQDSDIGSFIGSFTDKEDLLKFIEVHKNIIKKTDNMTGNEVRVLYCLKNGSKMQRTYYTTDYDACYNVLSLTDSDAYNNELEYLLSSKQKNNNEGGILKADSTDIFMCASESDIKTVLVSGEAKLISADGIVHNDIENTDALRDAILADRLALTYDEIYKASEKPLGYILFMDQKWHENYTDYGKTELNDSDEEVDYSYEGISKTFTYYIYPSMTNTIDYLKSTGEYSLLKADDSLERYNITSARIMKVSDFRENKSNINFIEESRLGYVFERSAQKITYMGTADLSGGLYGDEFEIFNDGREIKDANQIKELSDASRIFGYVERDDYIVCFKNDDGACYTSLIRAADAPDFIK